MCTRMHAHKCTSLSFSLPLSCSHIPPPPPPPHLSCSLHSLSLSLLMMVRQLKHSGSTWGGGGGGGGGGGLETAEILLAESCHEQVSFESGSKQWKGKRISEIGWQRVPNRRCKKAEGILPKHFGAMLWDFEELLTWWTKVSCWFICT